MYIKQIEIGKYRHLENLKLGPFPKPSDASDLVVLAGPNGGGKSSVLELISLALSNMWSLTYSLNRTQSKSSFEVTIGLLPTEIELIANDQNTAGRNRHPEAQAYLINNGCYCRTFNFPGGEYSKNPPLHNAMHEVVLAVLRKSFSRPLGFHLGADRTYEKRDFDRNLLFNYTAYARYEHAWQFAFNTTSAQYKDMFDYLVSWRFHFTRRLGSYHVQKAAGTLEDPAQEAPKDDYGIILQKVFPGYQFIDKPEDAPTDLFVRIPTGDVVAFSDLSSGEKEVFFTLCFFQRHEVQEATIIVDEPELHLHPSLARLLIRTMSELKPRNQIWLATQSAEVIEEAGRDRVLFIRKNEQTKKAELVLATDEHETLLCLRDLFGQSGYIGLAKAMVFTEGRNASTDRKMLCKLFPHSTRDIKIIPANGCGEIERINRAVLAILQSNLGWCRFYLMRDRDYMTQQTVDAMKQRAGANLFVLERHEVENYLIHFEIMAKVLEEIFDVRLTAADVEARMLECARNAAGNVLRDMVAFRLNHAFRSEDFSIPKLRDGELQFSSGQGWPEAALGNLRTDLNGRTATVVSELQQKVNGHQFDTLFEACKVEIEQALNSNGWQVLFPGKELLEAFCRRSGIGKAPAFQNSIIKEMSAHRDQIPAELLRIMSEIVA
jgi:hypothetical protein